MRVVDKSRALYRNSPSHSRGPCCSVANVTLSICFSSGKYLVTSFIFSPQAPHPPHHSVLGKREDTEKARTIPAAVTLG